VAAYEEALRLKPKTVRILAEAAARADSKIAETHALLGSLLARKREMAGAVKEYREAIRLRPDFARPLLDLASVYAAQGDMQRAVQQLREAARSRAPEVARLAAEALRRLGEH
jgi:cytochrome c-type biogenesis protein CcmH/NrfG